jgi:hypothetical protein
VIIALDLSELAHQDGRKVQRRASTFQRHIHHHRRSDLLGFIARLL